MLASVLAAIGSNDWAIAQLSVAVLTNKVR